MVKALQFHPPPEELIEQLNNIPKQAMEVDPVISPTAMEVDAIKCKLLFQAFYDCPMFNPGKPSQVSLGPSHLWFFKASVVPGQQTKPLIPSLNFQFQFWQTGHLFLSLGFQLHIHFWVQETWFQATQHFHIQETYFLTSSYSLALGSNPPRSILDFQVPGSTHLNSLPATNPASPSALAQGPSASPFLLPSQNAGQVPIVPTAKDVVVAFVPAPILVQTLDWSTPHPPCPTKLLDLDPISPHARGLHHHHNLAVQWEDGQLDPKIGNLANTLAKIWERAFDPDPSPDPVVRNFQDAIDKVDIPPEDLTEDLPKDSMDLDYGDIHQEALKCLPDKISTTSHYRYVLATLRREKERLLEQIETDCVMVAAMDATLDALRPFAVDKGKGRDQG